jgi:Na(+)-translocating NADH:ubiquinone oxidoreductase A subunit
MSTPKKAFKGGYRFKNFRGKPLDIVVNIDAPERITVPLKQGYGEATEPTVALGDSVKAGQIIGKNVDVLSSPVHSSVSGKVVEITKLTIGDHQVSAVIIEKNSDFTFEQANVQKISGHDPDWKRLQADKIAELIYLSGAASLDSCGIPTKYGSSSVNPEDIEHVIVQAVEDDLLAPSPRVLLNEEALDRFVDGCGMLKRVLPGADVTVAVSKNIKPLAQELQNRFEVTPGISVVTVSDKYPQSLDEVLVPTVLGGGFPYGFEAANLGVTVVSVQTVLHVFDAVAEGMPVLHRLVALGGSGFLENVYLRVPIGTPGSHITANNAKIDREYRLVCNSLLNGPTITDTSLPVTRTCSAVYAIPEAHSTEMMSFATPGFAKDSYSKTFPTAVLPLKKKLDTNLHGEERACLSCSFCSEVCPVGILPNVLHRYVERDIVDESIQQLGVFRCIDCNLCTYVCPSKIPVAQLIKQGKDRLRSEGLTDDDTTKQEFTLKGIE